MAFKSSGLFSLLLASVFFVGCSETPVPTDDADEDTTTDSADDAKQDAAAATQPSSTEFANAFCPIMFHKISGEGEITNWDDQTIGYCCDGCKEKFDKLSDDEKKAALAKADDAAKAATEDVDPKDEAKKDETQAS
jgi:PBP1b-binding outer membrane lipoprotein LpoB